MDVGQVGGILGGGGAIGAAAMAVFNRLYGRGRHDGRVTAEAATVAASIVRIEMSVAEMSKEFQRHQVEDAANFAELKATTNAAIKAMGDTMDAVRDLTQRIDDLIQSRHK